MPQIKHHGSRRATLDEAGLETLRQRAQDAVAELAAAESGSAADDQQIHIHVHGGDQEGAGTRTTDAATIDRIAALEEGQEAIQATLGEILAAIRTTDAKADPVNTRKAPPDDPGTGNTAAKNRKFVNGKKPEGTQDGDMEDEDDDDGDDGANATRDSAALQTSYMEMLSQAEVLVPGFKVPTFDAAAKRATTVDRMCTSRRLCLSQFATTDSGAMLLRGLNGGKDADIVSMDCAAVASTFKSASAAQAVLNNTKVNGAGGTAAKTNDAAANLTPAGYKKPPTIQEQNEINRKFWEGK